MTKSVYIHIPFCDNICSYCGFCKQFYQKDMSSKYLEALKKEIELNYQGEELETIYIGGGTPSALSIKDLEKLFQIIKIFKFASNYEFTIEVNPENINLEKLKLMKGNGVNRISIGIESFDDNLLKYLNRKYDKQLIYEKIRLIKEVGFNNINVDLMYAIKNETIDILENDLENILKLDINHVSTYSLMIEPNTVLGINKEVEIEEDFDYLMYQKICNVLKKNGFNHYEVSNFSKNGFESRHNLVYWHNEEYYGFGLGASGYVNNIRYDNTKSMTNYLKGNYVLNKECLSSKDIISYELILGFRLINGINKKIFFDKYKKELIEMYNIKELIEKNDLIDNGENIFINYDKIYIENSILINFVGE